MKPTGPMKETALKAIGLLEQTSRKQKNGLWKDVAAMLSKPRRKRVAINVWKINKLAAKTDKKFLLVPGKVLSYGSLDKAVNVIAFEYSSLARKKIGEKGKTLSIEDAIRQKINASDVAIVC